MVLLVLTGAISCGTEDQDPLSVCFKQLNGALNCAHQDFSDADLSGAVLEEADFLEANLEGADLSGAYLKGARLMGANLEGADLSGANLKEADLSFANVQRVNLKGAKLLEATLNWTNFSGANLSGANLNLATLGMASADKNTVWPDEFDPVAAGVIFG